MKEYKLVEWYPTLKEEWKDKEVILQEMGNIYCEKGATAGKAFFKKKKLKTILNIGY